VVLVGDDLGKIENVLIEFSMPPSQSNNCEPGNSCMIENRELDVDDVSWVDVIPNNLLVVFKVTVTF
jgi:hypothetical protein